MHHGNPPKKKKVQLHALWKISAVRMSQKGAVTLPFILHSPFTYHLEARSHHSSVPLPVLLVSLHWRKLSPHIPSPCIAERKSTTRHECGATPPINPRKLPAASCGTGSSLIMPAKGFFPNKNAAAPHARKKVWSIARKGVEREYSRKGNTGSHEQPSHTNTPLPRISPKIKITKKHATSQPQIAGAVAADTPTSWACAAPRCSALQVKSPKAPIREHLTTATAVTLPISHKGKGLQWRSGRRHAQSQSNGLSRELRNGNAPLLLGSPTKKMCCAVPVSNTH
ncbi:hypothetical protein TCDM_10719 [Trypanosoma cruzi Dm28c]|uniref:Uncharacterized protein n=1 Tax=Trypanosoma cruzi Dm28c TaxID=1416333 RepID=V5BBA2_TRYCR|nr:hypothetical protein TCDM_10719 [Trypanosoma cruzi Dm28c]